MRFEMKFGSITAGDWNLSHILLLRINKTSVSLSNLFNIINLIYLNLTIYRTIQILIYLRDRLI